MKSISIVHSEMQLLNCIEAINYYHPDDNILLVANISTRNEKILSFLNRHKINTFKKIYNFKLFKGNSRLAFHVNFVYSVLVVLFVTYRRSFEFVILSNYLEYIQRFLLYMAVKEKNENVVLVDDGLATLIFPKIRRQEFETRKPIVTLGRDFFSKFIPIKKEQKLIPASITYFTNIKMEEIECFDKLVKNDYVFLKSNLMSKMEDCDRNSVFVIGQPFVEENIMSKDDYQNVLIQVGNVFCGYKLVYCPHPVEQSVNSKLPGDSPYVIFKNEDPFEITALSLLSGNIILGFSSTLLTNINFLRKDLKVLYVRTDHLLNCTQERLEEERGVYDYFSDIIEELKIES